MEKYDTRRIQFSCLARASYSRAPSPYGILTIGNYASIATVTNHPSLLSTTAGNVSMPHGRCHAPPSAFSAPGMLMWSERMLAGCPPLRVGHPVGGLTASFPSPTSGIDPAHDRKPCNGRPPLALACEAEHELLTTRTLLRRSTSRMPRRHAPCAHKLTLQVQPRGIRRPRLRRLYYFHL